MVSSSSHGATRRRPCGWTEGKTVALTTVWLVPSVRPVPAIVKPSRSRRSGGGDRPVREDVAVTPDGPDETPAESLAVRPPLQQRSREAWTRVLDAGVALLEEGGYEAFTIAAVCERAQVAPRALYARVDTKDALFLAVYEHGIARVLADQAVLTDGSRWSRLPAAEVAVRAVQEVAGIFHRNAAFLRSVVLLSGAHAEVYRRGAHYTRDLADQFTALVLAAGEIDQPDPAVAVRAAFNAVFSSLVVRTAYGPAFAGPTADDEAFLETLAAMVRRYLYGDR
jgi:AcrR family transcriptional regulator